jgi:hypothetical protein
MLMVYRIRDDDLEVDPGRATHGKGLADGLDLNSPASPLDSSLPTQIVRLTGRRNGSQIGMQWITLH